MGELGSLGECCKLPKWGVGQSSDQKCILDALRAQKMRLVAANVVQFPGVLVSRTNSAELLDAIVGTLRNPLKNTAIDKPLYVSVITFQLLVVLEPFLMNVVYKVSCQFSN